MSKVSGEPYKGPLVADATSVKELLVDLAAGTMQHLRSEQPGIAEVVTELANNVPTSGEAAGIAPAVHARFVESTANLAKLRAVHGTIAKLLEVVEESDAFYEHQREEAVSQMADAVRSSARRTDNPALAAPFEALLRYNAQIAEKGVRTRRANAAAVEQRGAEKA